MKKLSLALSVALAFLFAGSAFAQSGEVGSSPASAPRAKKGTSQEQADAKAERKSAGSEAAKAGNNLGLAPDAKKNEKVAKPERQAARKARKASAAEAQKKGETKHGEQ